MSRALYISRIVVRSLFALLFTPLFVVGCEESSGEEIVVEPNYGYLYMDGEPIPVNSYFVDESVDMVLLTLSPLDSAVGATSYVKIGVKREDLDRQINVAAGENSKDYLFIYEDPYYLYSDKRALRSGYIQLDVRDGVPTFARINVILYDGRPFLYENSDFSKQITLRD
ncbi:MAG: hypothetical protein UHY58_07330 [Alistipes sp.]|nr:hypothetical protein [Alistipes sp.]